MAKKIYGDLSATGNVQINGSNTIRDINDIQADVNGNIVIPTYTKSYIDKFISMAPVSRVGTLDYLPMDINGSYEGATTLYTERGFPLLVENDGTLVYLRPGTNGSTKGYYYCYSKNIRTANNFMPITTGKEYIPNFFTSHVIDDFVACKADEVMMMRVTNGSTETYTIALTYGTMNSDVHQYVSFARTLIDGDPQFVHIVGNLVYIWCIGSYTNTDEYSLNLYTISTANVSAGVTTSLTKVTGFSGRNLYNTVVSASANIKIAPTIVSTSSASQPFMLTDAATAVSPFYNSPQGMIYAAQNEDETNIRVSIFKQVYASNTLGGSVSHYGISFSYNISTKTYTWDNIPSGARIYSMGSSQSTPVNVTDPYAMNMADYNGLLPQTVAGLNMFQTNDGIALTIVSRYVLAEQHRLLRTYITDFTSNYDSLNLTTRKVNGTEYKLVMPYYGSAIGSNLVNPTIISSTRIMFAASGTENGVSYDYDNKVYTDIGTTRTYTYNSVLGGTRTGYAPNTNRHHLDNSDDAYTGLIQLIDASGNVSVYGTTFIEGYTKTTGGLMNPSTFAFANNYTLNSTALLTTLKNSIISASAVHSGNITDSKIVLYYVPDSSFGSSIAITTYITDTVDGSGYNGYVIVSKVTATVSGTNITALSSTYNSQLQTVTTALTLSYQYIKRMTGLVIAKYSGFSYIGIPGIININRVGDASFRSVIGKLDASNNFVSMKAITSYFISTTPNAFEVGVLPGVGFGLYLYGQSDYQSKLVFSNCGTTSAQLDALIATPVSVANAGTQIVMAAQDVPQGFIVYFTQAVPALIQGSYYELPIQSYDLSTVQANPANTTFYLYVVVVEGECTYQFSTTLLSEELYRTYIGTVVTGASGITSIVSEKVTRFLTDRPSTTKRGSAIPTSTGVPSGTGTRWN